MEFAIANTVGLVLSSRFHVHRQHSVIRELTVTFLGSRHDFCLGARPAHDAGSILNRIRRPLSFAERFAVVLFCVVVVVVVLVVVVVVVVVTVMFVVVVVVVVVVIFAAVVAVVLSLSLSVVVVVVVVLLLLLLAATPAVIMVGLVRG